MSLKSFFILACIAVIACNKTPKQEEAVTESKTQEPGPYVIQDTTEATNKESLFTQEDAESILGEPAVAVENQTSKAQNIEALKLTYRAVKEAADKEKTGAVYFLLEDFNLQADAQTKYAFIKASNENSPGFKMLDDLGDEAYFHSDNENFYFTMVRKGTKVFTMKVNKITSKTSIDAFHQVTQKITAAL